MLSIHQYFKPAGQQFYSMTTVMADNIRQMSQQLVQFCYEDNLNLQKAMLLEIETLEHDNDKIVRSLIIYLEKTLTAPFDREDIHTLITSLDDIADNIYYLAKQRIIYGIKGLPKQTLDLVEKIRTVTKILYQVIDSLSNKKDILKLSVFNTEMRAILHDCDTMADEALSNSFSEKNDIIETIKLTDHYIYIQTLISKFVDVVEVIDTIAIKYS